MTRMEPPNWVIGASKRDDIVLAIRNYYQQKAAAILTDSGRTIHIFFQLGDGDLHRWPTPSFKTL